MTLRAPVYKSGSSSCGITRTKPHGTTWDEDGMWQLSDSFSDEKNHKAVSHPALLMLVKLNYHSIPQP